MTSLCRAGQGSCCLAAPWAGSNEGCKWGSDSGLEGGAGEREGGRALGKITPSLRQSFQDCRDLMLFPTRRMLPLRFGK